MNVPNLITTARLVLTAAVFVLLEWAWLTGGQRTIGDTDHATQILQPDPTLVWSAFWLFLVAAFTDFLDGHLARKWNMVTAFGRIADPFADKVLIAGTLVVLLKYEDEFGLIANGMVFSSWFVVIVIAREFLVTAIRGYVESTGEPFPADRLGKYKMVAQCWTCGALLTMVAGCDTWIWAAFAGFWVSLVLTAFSGLNYVWKARKIVLAGAI